jgi:hypothetical protein
MTAPIRSEQETARRLCSSAAAFIAAQPDGPERLLALHTPDAAGHCRGCTTPGYGTPHGRWPCAPVLLAGAATALVAP